MDPLDVDIPSLLTFGSVPESPRLDPPDVGLRLRARGVAWDGEALSFELLAGHLFEAGFAGGFQRLSEGIVVGLEDAQRGRAAAVRIHDPWKRYPRRQGPNFGGIRAPAPGAPTHSGGSAVMPLRVRLEGPLEPGPSLYVTAFLHQHVSNTLAFDVPDGSVASFLGGEPREIPAEADEEPPAGDAPGGPSPRRGGTPALALGARTSGAVARGAPVVLDATLALAEDELAAFGPEGWLRSLFLWTSARDTQATRVGQWLEGRAVFADDFQVQTLGGEPRAVATASFELPHDLAPGVHHVHVSARHHRSSVLELTCA